MKGVIYHGIHDISVEKLPQTFKKPLPTLPSQIIFSLTSFPLTIH